jgi:dimethylargininase
MVLDEVALIFPLGTESRRAEAASLAKVLSPFRELKHVRLPGTAEGGDILRVGRHLFAGLSKRTNEEGIRQLQSIVGDYGYTVSAVRVTGCLHLKSAVTFLGRDTLLANRKWFDASCMPGFEWIDVAPEEPHAANALAFGDTIILPASFPLTRKRIEARGFTVLPLDISELQKAESGLTCSSLLFDARTLLSGKERPANAAAGRQFNPHVVREQQDQSGFLISGPACSILPGTRMVFTSVFCPASRFISVS